MQQIIVHRGYKNISYDNSLMGVLTAIFQHKFTEFDILFVHGKWRMCHDFRCLTRRNSYLTDLLEIIKNNKGNVRNNIIIDIKWDFSRNRNDNLHDAIQQLKDDLIGNEMEEMPIWLQASNINLLGAIIDHGLQDIWVIGLLLPCMESLRNCKHAIDYAMIPIDDTTLEQVTEMSAKCPLYGYTCHNIDELERHRHLFSFIKGFVCDVLL